MARWRWCVVAFGVGCGGAGAGGGDAAAPASDPGGATVTQKVVVEEMPDGSTRRTTITTTTRTVAAPPPPPRPADPWPSDPAAKYNVDQVNAYRAKGGLPPLLYDAKISAFAAEGSTQLASDHTAHAHFAAKAGPAAGFGSRAAENQGDPAGVPSMDADAAASERKQIDVMLKLMMDEGPGGGHYDNIMSPKLRRIGVGLVYAGGRLYMTNDFSD